VLGAVACADRPPPPKPPDQQVREALVAYNTAIADGDAVRACRLLTPEGQKAVEDIGLVGAPRGEPADCQAAAAALPKQLRELERVGGGEQPSLEELKFGRVSAVVVRGTEARAQVEAAGDAEPAELERVATEWKIARPPGLSEAEF